MSGSEFIQGAADGRTVFGVIRNRGMAPKAASTALLAGLVLLLAGCQDRTPHVPPPLSVQMVTVKVQSMTHTYTALGTVTPLQMVQVVPQTSGMLKSVDFTAGEMVHQGQLLFTIDPSQAIAAFRQAQAKLAADRATAIYDTKIVEQDKPLVEKDFITRQAFDQAVAQAEAAKATVEADAAALRQAQLNLSYTRISAPITGRIGLANVKAGNLVVANQTALAVINQMQPIAVNLAVPQGLLEAARKLKESGDATVAILDERDQRPLSDATLDFVDNAVNAATGTVALQAQAANRDLQLWPGQYVLVRLPIERLPRALTLPAGAVQQGVDGPYVYVVQDGTARMKPVKLLWEEDASAVIDGLPAGTPVVYPVPVRLHPDAKVRLVGAEAGHGHGAQAPRGPRP